MDQLPVVLSMEYVKRMLQCLTSELVLSIVHVLENRKHNRTLKTTDRIIIEIRST